MTGTTDARSNDELVRIAEALAQQIEQQAVSTAHTTQSRLLNLAKHSTSLSPAAVRLLLEAMDDVAQEPGRRKQHFDERVSRLLETDEPHDEEAVRLSIDIHAVVVKDEGTTKRSET